MNQETQGIEGEPAPKRRYFDDEDFRTLKGGFYAAVGSSLGLAIMGALGTAFALVFAHYSPANNSNNAENADS